MFNVIENYGYENEEVIKTLFEDQLDQYVADNDFFKIDDLWDNGEGTHIVAWDW